MDDRSRERRLDALYAAVRDSATVDRQAAFDIAMNELEYVPLHAEARELAEASVADDDETRLTSAAAAFLDAYGYEPGFEQAPERFARLERALDAVRADIRATGLTGEVRLVRPGWTPRNAVIETWAGDQGWTSGIFPSEAADDLSALVAVAEQARQAIMESLRYQSTGRVWPACPAHGLGTSPMARHGTGVWWCDGGDGHAAAEIGHWARGSSPGYGESHACQPGLPGAALASPSSPRGNRCRRLSRRRSRRGPEPTWSRTCTRGGPPPARPCRSGRCCSGRSGSSRRPASGCRPGTRWRAERVRVRASRKATAALGSQFAILGLGAKEAEDGEGFQLGGQASEVRGERFQDVLEQDKAVGAEHRPGDEQGWQPRVTSHDRARLIADVQRALRPIRVVMAL